MICRDFYTGIAGDGVGDGVSIPNDDRLNIVGPVTMGMWVKLEGRSATAGSSLFGKWDSGNGTPYTFRVATGGGLSFLDGDGAAIYSVSVDSAYGRLATGPWCHVAVSRDESRRVVFYMNGVAVQAKTLAAATPIGVANALEIGSRAGGGDSINGKYDEPFIYGRVLTPQEIWGIYDAGNYPQGPVLLFRFDEGVGTTTRDTESGNGWIGTLIGNARFTQQVPCSPPPIDRDITGAYKGDPGGTRYVSFSGFNGALDGKTGLAVSAWVRPHTFQSGSVIVFAGLSTTAGANCSLGIGATRLWGAFARSAAEAGSQFVQSLTAEVQSTPGSQWTHVSANVDYAGALMQLFVNGVLTNQNAAPVFDQRVYTPNSTPAFTVGSSGGGVIPTAAFVADAMLFNRVLTKDEHRALYLYGNPPPSDLELRWKLNEPNDALVAIDSSGKGRHGALFGPANPVWNFQPLSGPFA